MTPVVLESSLGGLKLISKGKVRDIYEKGDDLLLVTTDRISAFDHILPNGIPGKGCVLNQISLFWFDLIKDIVPNHVKTTDLAEMGLEANEELKGRTLLCKKATVFPIECVARGYLAGSSWKEYKANGTVCGIKLPTGLTQCAKLPEPIFTPATKATSGHDENISFEAAAAIIGEESITKLRDLTLAIYNKGAEEAAKKGIIICDTKFEFGTLNGEIIIIDEMLTPDSSRFWSAENYAAGRDQDSYDKQIVRNYLESINWNKEVPVPTLPDDIIEKTSAKYIEIYEILTGKKFDF